MKLESLLKKWGGWGRKEAREQLFAEKIKVNGRVVTHSAFQVGKFDHVSCGEQVVQNVMARYLMLHKPLGVVSATRDEQHRTVIDLVEEEWAGDLHLAGRLDRFTSGLLLLTNDSTFSEAITEPQRKIGKVYRVGCDGLITREMIQAFEAGIWMAKEGVRTQPAQVELLGDTDCLLTIYEGKHHQVKRMFAQFGVKVTSLHREQVGPWKLDVALEPGAWRHLAEEEVREVGESVL